VFFIAASFPPEWFKGRCSIRATVTPEAAPVSSVEMENVPHGDRSVSDVSLGDGLSQLLASTTDQSTRMLLNKETNLNAPTF